MYTRWIIRNDAKQSEQLFSGLWYNRKKMEEILKSL